MSSGGFVNEVARAIWRDRWARTGAGFLVIAILVAVGAPLLSPYAPGTVHREADSLIVALRDATWTTRLDVGDVPLYGVALTGPGSGWAVGAGGTVLRLDKGATEPVQVPTDADLMAVAVSDDHVLVVGSEGTVLRFDGQGWSVEDIGADVTLHGVAVDRSGGAIAVGAGGRAYGWDGERWTAISTPVNEDLYGASLSGPDAGFVVGAKGTILVYQDGSMTGVLPPTFRDLRAVDAVDAGHAVAVGVRGTILELRDGTWVSSQGPTSRDLYAVAVDDVADAWAVGENGTAIRLTGGEWVEADTGTEHSLLGLDLAAESGFAVGAPPKVAALSPPSAAHWLGTTQLGQDVLSQTIWGSRTALLVGFAAALAIVFIGANVGLISGYFRGRTDAVMMRIVDITFGIPFEPFALVLVVVFQPSLIVIILAIAALSWRTTARIVRSQVLSLAERPFVKAARIAGARDWRILYVHLAPNVLPLIFLQLAVAVAFAITAEATLSFLGLGSAESFSWGGVLFDARISGGWRTAWWWVVPPGLAIMFTVVSVFFISRALESFANPRLKEVGGVA